jgi:hypothetical protein
VCTSARSDLRMPQNVKSSFLFYNRSDKLVRAKVDVRQVDITHTARNITAGLNAGFGGADCGGELTISTERDFAYTDPIKAGLAPVKAHDSYPFGLEHYNEEYYVTVTSEKGAIFLENQRVTEPYFFFVDYLNAGPLGEVIKYGDSVKLISVNSERRLAVKACADCRYHSAVASEFGEVFELGIPSAGTSSGAAVDVAHNIFINVSPPDNDRFALYASRGLLSKVYVRSLLPNSGNFLWELKKCKHGKEGSTELFEGEQLIIQNLGTNKHLRIHSNNESVIHGKPVTKWILIKCSQPSETPSVSFSFVLVYRLLN